MFHRAIYTTLFALLACTFLQTVKAVVIPGADTPLFHLVSSSTDGSNLKPLRVNGGSNGFASLTGSGPIGQFYFVAGNLVARAPDGSAIPTLRPIISSTLTANGCTPGGPLGWVQGAGSNKCERGSGFYISSNSENGQLGARLVFNWVGGFYACGGSQDVYYKVDASEGPSGCTPINLWTVPVS